MAESNGMAEQDVEMNISTEVPNEAAGEPTADVKVATGKKLEAEDSGSEKSETDKHNSSEEPLSDLEKQIIRQVEYYFGDINLPRDKFLQEQIKLDDGWIPLDVMLKFKRLHSLSSDPKVIVAALEKSPEMLMEISEDKNKIRRSPKCPLPILNEEWKKELMSRSVYCKGFPVEGTTLDMLLKYFASYGPVDNIQMRYIPDKPNKKFTFKGSVFAMFKTVELAEKFLALESVKYEDTELIRKWQLDYLEGKKKEREERKLKRKSGSAGAGPEKKHKDDKEKQEDALPKGSVLNMKGFSGDVTREDIKEKLIKLGAQVVYIYFDKGDSEAFARLQGENAAAPIVEKIKQEKFELCNCEIEVRALEGEEEEAFLVKAKEEIGKKRNSFGYKNKRGRGGGRGRGGRGGGRGGRDRESQGDRKRKGSPVEGEAHVKKEVTA